MAKGSKWGAISGQMARIADQGRAEREASKAHEAMTSKPDKAVTVPEPAPVEEPANAAPAVANKPIEEMSLEEMGAALNASTRANMERQEREIAEYNAARARGEEPALRKGTRVVRRKQRVSTPTVEEPAKEPPPPRRHGEPVAFKAERETVKVAAPEIVSRTPKGATTTAVIETSEPDKAKKKSTSLYLSGAASRALHTIAAQQGVRPHRVLDDALRAEFRRHGLDFDDLNAKD